MADRYKVPYSTAKKLIADGKATAAQIAAKFDVVMDEEPDEWTGSAGVMAKPGAGFNERNRSTEGLPGAVADTVKATALENATAYGLSGVARATTGIASMVSLPADMGADLLQAGPSRRLFAKIQEEGGGAWKGGTYPLRHPIETLKTVIPDMPLTGKINEVTTEAANQLTRELTREGARIDTARGAGALTADLVDVAVAAPAMAKGITKGVSAFKAAREVGALDAEARQLVKAATPESSAAKLADEVGSVPDQIGAQLEKAVAQEPRAVGNRRAQMEDTPELIKRRQELSVEHDLPPDHKAIVAIAEKEYDRLTTTLSKDRYWDDVDTKPPPAFVSEVDLAAINATNTHPKFGEPWSDARLAVAGRTLRDLVGDAGTVYRKGGDEFVIHWNDEASSAAIREVMPKALDEAFVSVARNGKPVAQWTGVDHYIGHGPTFEDASAALYTTKPKAGGPGYKTLPPELAARMEAGRIRSDGDPAVAAGIRGSNGGPEGVGEAGQAGQARQPAQAGEGLADDALPPPSLEEGLLPGESEMHRRLRLAHGKREAAERAASVDPPADFPPPEHLNLQEEGSVEAPPPPPPTAPGAPRGPGVLPEAPPVKTKEVGLLARNAEPMIRTIGRQGKVGARVAKELDAVRMMSAQLAGEPVEALQRVMKFSDAKKKQFIGLLDGTIPWNGTVDGEVLAAARQHSAFRDKYHARAVKAGVEEIYEDGTKGPVRYRKNYFPTRHESDSVGNYSNEVQPGAFSGNLRRARGEGGSAESTVEDLMHYYRRAANDIAETTVFGNNKTAAIAQRADAVAAEGRDGAYVKDALSQILGGGVRYSEVELSAANKLKAIGTAVKLPTAVISNATQIAMTASQTSMKATAKAVKDLASASTRPGVMELYAKSGAGVDTMLHGMTVQGDEFGKVAAQILSKTGFSAVEKFNRIVAASAGANYADELYALVRAAEAKGTKVAKVSWYGREVPVSQIERDLGELGVDVRGALKQNLDSLPDTDRANAAFHVSERAQLSPGKQALPLTWGRSPWTGVVFQFKSFSLKQAWTINDRIITPLRKTGDVGPLVRFLGVGVPITAAGTVLRQQIFDRDTDLSGAVADSAGALLMLDQISRLYTSGDRGDAVTSLTGPAVGDVNTIGALAGETGRLGAAKLGFDVAAPKHFGDDVAKAVKKLVPVTGAVLNRTNPPKERKPKKDPLEFDAGELERIMRGGAP